MCRLMNGLLSPDQFFAVVETFLRGGWPAGAERVSDTGLR